MSNKNRNNRSKTRTLDFNTVERPTLRLVMQDDARTEILVTTPTEGLVEELEHIRPKFEAMVTDKDKFDIQALYEFAAKAMNCNRSFVTVTAEELADKNKYRMNLESLVIFFGAYVDFIEGITNLKN